LASVAVAVAVKGLGALVAAVRAAAAAADKPGRLADIVERQRLRKRTWLPCGRRRRRRPARPSAGAAGATRQQRRRVLIVAGIEIE
jgi:hypothetical protein